MLRKLKPLLRIVLSILLRILPAYRHSVVVGWPDTEGNSVEVLRWLIRHYSGKIYWLVSKPCEELCWQISDIEEHKRVYYVQKNRLKGLIVYLTAELVFFTHGLFQSPLPNSRRIFVNLWHGDGPKRTENKEYRAKIPSTYIVAGTKLWGEYKANFFGLKPERAMVVGNPRIDQFDRPATDTNLQQLGVDPSKKFILWLPTYREVKGNLNAQWSDGRKLSAQEEIKCALEHLVTTAMAKGLQVIFKPHPMEADLYRNTGVKIIADADLAVAHVPFYSFIARSAALITDYSSVWTDYFPLNRPIAFFCPDMEEYQMHRGFNVNNLSEILPGRRLVTMEDIVKFVNNVEQGCDPECEMRNESVRRIGAVTKTGATERLFALLPQKTMK